MTKNKKLMFLFFGLISGPLIVIIHKFIFFLITFIAEILPTGNIFAGIIGIVLPFILIILLIILFAIGYYLTAEWLHYKEITIAYGIIIILLCLFGYFSSDEIFTLHYFMSFYGLFVMVKGFHLDDRLFHRNK